MGLAVVAPITLARVVMLLVYPVILHLFTSRELARS
jgi:hypothetical protein